MKRASAVCRLIVAGLTGLTAVSARADEISVAVAANFTAPAKEIAALFAQRTQHRLVLSFGSTGQLYAQITQGAPFDVFLAADQATPQKLVDQGLAAADSRFTYAIGRLVLYSKSAGLVQGEQTLVSGRFDKIAIANPAAAPYGTAAVEVMKRLGVYDALEKKIVQGNNVAQAFQFVETGNAELGFVALSQVAKVADGSKWIVPDKYYAPIAQDAVMLNSDLDKDAERMFMAFLRGPEAGRVIERFGYAVSE